MQSFLSVFRIRRAATLNDATNRLIINNNSSSNNNNNNNNNIRVGTCSLDDRKGIRPIKSTTITAKSKLVGTGSTSNNSKNWTR